MKGKEPRDTRARRAGGSMKLAAARDVLSIFSELGRMVWERRLWWILPMLLALVVVGALLLVGSSPVAPIFYPLF